MSSRKEAQIYRLEIVKLSTLKRSALGVCTSWAYQPPEIEMRSPTRFVHISVFAGSITLCSRFSTTLTRQPLSMPRLPYSKRKRSGVIGSCLRCFPHPLVLPEPCFKCSSALDEMWQKAESYGAADSVPAAERAITAFEREYHQRIQFQTRGQALRQQTKWMDTRGLVFDENGARHGAPPVPRSWKLSYRLIDGFHYDISKLSGDRFEIVDQAGAIHRVVKDGYINIDAHGYVR